MKRSLRRYLETGMIWRDGHLVDKEEWYKAHPTRQMLAEQQATVDDAVANEMATKFSQQGNPGEVGAPPTNYFCTKCNHTHKPGTKIHEQHKNYSK